MAPSFLTQGPVVEGRYDEVSSPRHKHAAGNNEVQSAYLDILL